MRTLTLSIILFVLTISSAQSASFIASSSSIIPDEIITNNYVFNSFGCSGTNISPQISWANAPEGTKSFAITVYDPDAPTGSGWWHWIAFNIPTHISSIPEGASNNKQLPPNTIESVTDFGTTGYGGPCPPKGDKPHRYIFKIHALKIDTLPLDHTATAAMVGFYLNANALATTSFTALYGR